MFQLGAVTYNVLKDWDLETVITKLEQAGFAAVELRAEHKHGVEPSMTKEQREEVKARFAKSKVRLLSYGSALMWLGAPKVPNNSNNVGTLNKP